MVPEVKDFKPMIEDICFDIIKKEGWKNFNDIDIIVQEQLEICQPFITLNDRVIHLAFNPLFTKAVQRTMAKYKLADTLENTIYKMMYLSLNHEYGHHQECPISQENMKNILQGSYDVLSDKIANEEELVFTCYRLHNLFSDTVLNAVKSHTSSNPTMYKEGFDTMYLVFNTYAQELNKFKQDKAMTLFLNSNHVLSQTNPQMMKYLARSMPKFFLGFNRYHNNILNIFTGDEKVTTYLKEYPLLDKKLKDERSTEYNQVLENLVGRLRDSTLWKQMSQEYTEAIYPFMKQKEDTNQGFLSRNMRSNSQRQSKSQSGNNYNKNNQKKSGSGDSQNSYDNKKDNNKNSGSDSSKQKSSGEDKDNNNSSASKEDANKGQSKSSDKKDQTGAGKDNNKDKKDKKGSGKEDKDKNNKNNKNNNDVLIDDNENTGEDYIPNAGSGAFRNLIQSKEHKPYSSKYVLQYARLDRMFRNRAYKIALYAEENKEAPHHDQYLGKDDMPFEEFNTKDIIWSATQTYTDKNGNKRIQLFKKDAPVRLPFESNMSSGGIPDLGFIYDSSMSMEFDPDKQRGEYFVAVQAFYSILGDLEGKGIAPLLNYATMNFANEGQTVFSGWQDYYSMRRVKEALFDYQSGSTHLDVNKFRKMIDTRRDNSIIFMLTDTGFNSMQNTMAVLQELERAKSGGGVGFYLFNLAGADTFFSKSVEDIGFNSQNIRSAQDFNNLALAFTKELYGGIVK